jgi:peptide/nickel transport system substrate-binding protein
MKVFLVCTLCVLGLLCACKQQSQTEAQLPIHFAIAQAPLNLDPRYATDAASERVNRLIYQPLVAFDAASNPTPALASWRVINDSQYQFTLNKKRALFHYQKILTTEDVKATYESILALKDSPHTAEFSNIKNIEIVDQTNVVFHLKVADKNFVEKLIIGVLPKDLINIHHDFSRNPVGSGALKFVAWQDKLTLQRLSDAQMIVLQEVKDPTVRVLKLLRGEADLIQGDLPPELVKYLQGKPKVKVNTSVGANFSYLGLNFNDPQLQNIKVRQAIMHAINRQAIIDKVMVNNTRVAGAILPPEHYAGNAALAAYDYNPALSKKLLAETGVKLPLKLIYKTSTDAQRVRFATILQAQMQPAGIDLEIRSLDWGTFFEDVKQGNFQLYGLTWVGIKTPEIYNKAFGSQSFPPNGFNRGRYVDAKLDTLLANEDWSASTRYIHEQLPYIPLWYEGQFAAMQKNISHYAPKPDGNWDDLKTIARIAK